ncbi:GNAT family N-acetyltransferase [Microbacterium sp. 22242]|uniref:GNAT family N-acetyltransferase n=1 Tax=Microbacterium sp. 22242 TaxID=3453896 RepID=UPI003F86D0BB
MNVATGSWLTRSAHGRGIGTEMRAALLLFAFDVLGAEWAESGAASWNEASLAVSRKLGYEPNGVTRVAPRPGEAVDEQRLRLVRARFVRPDWTIAVRGAGLALAQLGLGAPRM